jgi:hypothetical protein
MNPIVRNFLSVIRQFKLAVVLNILGLSVAFAAFMVIMMQLHYDFSFDRFHKDYDRIFRVEIVQETVQRLSVIRLPGDSLNRRRIFLQVRLLTILREERLLSMWKMKASRSLTRKIQW